MQPIASDLTRSVQDCIESEQVPARGAALSALAVAYARQIDAALAPDAETDPARVLSELGPKLQAALVALGLAVVVPAGRETGKGDTAGRGQAGSGTTGPSGEDMLAALRAERDRRTG